MSQKRGQMSNKAPSSGGVFIEGMPPIEEYLRFRSHALKEIVYFTEKEMLQVNSALQVSGLAGKISVRQGAKTETSVYRRTPVAKIDIRALAFEAALEMPTFLESPLILALDHIQDPRNLGALVRSAAFFGVKFIIVPRDRQVLLTPASVATAQGGFALVDLVETTNLRRSLEILKERGFWLLGADAQGQPLKEFVNKFEKQIVVMGSEEQGLSRLVRSSCDCIVSVVGAEQRVESLNVAVAGGIFMHTLAQFS